MLQKGLMAWMMSAQKSFYRKIQTEGAENLPIGEKPLLFAPNHQNAFMDALVMITTSGTVPVFLTRADIFQSSFKVKMLRLLRMLPVYRQRDGKDSLKRNEETFDLCVELLKDKDSLGIFPEGNHGRRPRLRPLKKGVVRIAMDAETQSDFSLDVQIIPVGIHYSAHTEAYSDVLVSYGEPIAVRDYQEAYEKNPMRTFVSLTNDLRVRMEKLMIHIPNQEYLDTIESLRKMFGESLASRQGIDPNNLKGRLHVDQGFIAAIETFIKEEPAKAEQLQNQLQAYQTALETERLSDDFLAKAAYPFSRLLMNTLWLLLSLPVYIYGAINNLLLDYIPIRAAKVFKDDHFHASVEMLLRMFLKPLIYILQGGLVWAISGDWRVALAYLASVEITRYLSHAWRRGWKKISGHWKLQHLKRNKAEKFQTLIAMRDDLGQAVEDLFKTTEKIKA